jgi:DNA replication protein DnaC
VQAKIIGAKKSVNVHTLRNTFATNLMAQDVSVKKAGEVLGISDPKAIKRYTKESISRVTQTNTVQKSSANQNAKLESENKVGVQEKVIGDSQSVVEKNISKIEVSQKEISTISKKEIAVTSEEEVLDIAKILGTLDSRSKLRKFISKVFPSKPADMKASTSNALMSIQDQSQTANAIDPETILFGRSSVIEEITQNLSKGQSTLLTGKLGLGKSHILKHISSKLTPNRIYFRTMLILPKNT